MPCNHDHHPHSRRRFIGAMAAAGAGALLPPATLFSQAPASRGLIDVHHHLLPPTFITATQGRFVNPAQITSWSLDKAIAEMDANGVAVAFSSVTQPGVWLGKGVQAARALSRECNEYQARVSQDHPTRFGAFAVLPLPDTEGSLRELEYSLDTLKADGIGLLTSYEDKWLGDPLFMPVLEELNRRRAVVYVHPNAADCCRMLMPSVSPNMVEYPQDTTRAITNLLFTGALNRLRDIRFIFSHGGGTLPMLAGRIAQLATPRDLEKIPNGVEAELRRLYYEIANTAHRPAIAALKEVAPISQIMFGTDYPFVPIRSTAEGMTRVGLSAAEQRAIAFENAITLLPRAKARTQA
jgi:predicted TIM-barrel fold metal-dependent hydrolase